MLRDKEELVAAEGISFANAPPAGSSLAEVLADCLKRSDCGAVTGQPNGHNWQLRGVRAQYESRREVNGWASFVKKPAAVNGSRIFQPGDKTYFATPLQRVSALRIYPKRKECLNPGVGRVNCRFAMRAAVIVPREEDLPATLQAASESSASSSSSSSSSSTAAVSSSSSYASSVWSASLCGHRQCRHFLYVFY